MGSNLTRYSYVIWIILYLFKYWLIMICYCYFFFVIQRFKITRISYRRRWVRPWLYVNDTYTVLIALRSDVCYNQYQTLHYNAYVSFVCAYSIFVKSNSLNECLLSNTVVNSLVARRVIIDRLKLLKILRNTAVSIDSQKVPYPMYW